MGTTLESRRQLRFRPKPTNEQVLIAKAKNLRAIVEASHAHRWVDNNQPGLRLKDTTEWAEFYVALAKFNL